jgi:hypothetical protein
MFSTLAERLFSRRVKKEGRVNPFKMSSAAVNGSATGISNPQAAGVLSVKLEKELLDEANPLNTSGVFVEGLSYTFLAGVPEWSKLLFLDGLPPPAMGGNISCSCACFPFRTLRMHFPVPSLKQQQQINFME